MFLICYHAIGTLYCIFQTGRKKLAMKKKVREGSSYLYNVKACLNHRLESTRLAMATILLTFSDDGIFQRWANIYLHTLDSDLRFLPNRSPTSFTLFFQGRIEGQCLLPSIFCKVGVDGSMLFNHDSLKIDS